MVTRKNKIKQKSCWTSRISSSKKAVTPIKSAKASGADTLPKRRWIKSLLYLRIIEEVSFHTARIAHMTIPDPTQQNTKLLRSELKLTPIRRKLDLRKRSVSFYVVT